MQPRRRGMQVQPVKSQGEEERQAVAAAASSQLPHVPCCVWRLTLVPSPHSLAFSFPLFSCDLFCPADISRYRTHAKTHFPLETHLLLLCFYDSCSAEGTDRGEGDETRKETREWHGMRENL